VLLNFTLITNQRLQLQYLYNYNIILECRQTESKKYFPTFQFNEEQFKKLLL